MSDANVLFILNLFCAFVLPVLMTVITVLMFLGHPKRRNALFGYRTRRSMRSAESWKLAQAVCRRYFFVYTLVLWIATLFLWFFTTAFQNPLFGSMFPVLEAFLLLPVIPVTEHELKKHLF